MKRTLNIAICEDQSQDMARLYELIEKTLADTPLAPAIRAYSSAEELLSAFRPGRFDVVFLDMFMAKLTGMDAATAIRALDAACEIVFTTFSPEFALESYRVRATHYLIKPVCDRDLREVWARAVSGAVGASACITLIIDRRARDIPRADILYVEADNKICRVHTRAEVLAARIPIDQMEHMLSGGPFCRCHRGYIVNFDHVVSADDDFSMVNGDTVYIRRKESTRIREMYFQHLIDCAKPELPTPPSAR